MKKYIMALDAGTTSNRCIVFDRDAHIVAVSQQEFPQYYPHPGWVEQDARDIWESMYTVAREALERAHATADEVAGIGIANQRETTILWDRQTGEPIYRAIVWQCRRTADRIERLKSTSGIEKTVRGKTGLILDPYFSASKLEWILEEVDGARERAEAGDILFGTVETWLVWKLTGGRLHITDVSNASRTCLFNIHDMEWDDDLLELFHVPRAMLPRVVSNSELYGETDAGILGAAIPIGGLVGDQQAALFGQQCTRRGDAKVTYGTGAFLLLNTGEHVVRSENGLLSTVAWQLGVDGRTSYALEGSIFTAGSAIQWLRDEVGLIKDASETEKLALSVPDTAGCYLVPAFTGLGAPYWDAEARGALVGLTRAVRRAHIIRATLESLAYQVADVLDVMMADLDSDDDEELSSLKVDGGASNNGFLLQFQADLLRRSVTRPSNVESTALGCAYMAGLACGFWQEKELADLNPAEREFVPHMAEVARMRRIKGWKRAVAQTLSESGR